MSFHWFSEKVDEAATLGGEDALDALLKLIDEADTQKKHGFGPPQDDINKARRKWLAIYDDFYGRAA